MELSSPPRHKACFFWCSPKRVPRKKRKEDNAVGFGPDNTNRGNIDEILSDSSTFSLKEQQRKLKKALKEEEKITREAEKVVKWVKQASARMDVAIVEESQSH